MKYLIEKYLRTVTCLLNSIVDGTSCQVFERPKIEVFFENSNSSDGDLSSAESIRWEGGGEMDSGEEMLLNSSLDGTVIVKVGVNLLLAKSTISLPGLEGFEERTIGHSEDVIWTRAFPYSNCSS